MDPTRYQDICESSLTKQQIIGKFGATNTSNLPINQNIQNKEPEWWVKPHSKTKSLNTILKTLCEVNIENGKCYLTSETHQSSNHDDFQYPSMNKSKPIQ